MTDNDKVIQVYLSKKDSIKSKTGINQYVVNSGIEHAKDIVSKLVLNGKDAIYIHLTKPITKKDIYNTMRDLCGNLVDRRKVLYADYAPLSMPDGGVGYHTTFDADNNIIEDRYMIIYRKG